MPMNRYTFDHGAVTRGPRDAKILSLIFTGGGFGEGASVVLDSLEKHNIKGSFYLTGDFIRNPENYNVILRMVAEGHIVGPHSNNHLLYCPWDDRAKTLVTRDTFLNDLAENTEELKAFGVSDEAQRWWIPPYEWYNEEISQWAREAGRPIFNFTPGTLSHADYTEDDAPNYRSNEVIWDSIINGEAEEPSHLNGFILLMHLGAGEGRTEKFFNRLDALILWLKGRGYQFVTIPELLSDAG